MSLAKTVVLNVVGLTPELLDDENLFLSRWARQGAQQSVNPVLPAVTCSVQSSYLTGTRPDEHGIVGNGWYFRDLAEVIFWHQSNHLVQAPKLWDEARTMDEDFTCANLFWWYNMYSTVDYSVTPRPMYPSDGRKIPDVYTQPRDLRFKLQEELGQFPLFNFWGPNSSIASSEWIAASARRVEERFHPTLTLIYLPHLDYGLQKMGPDDPSIKDDVRQIDGVCQELIEFYEDQGARVVVLSEYGIEPVDQPVSLNRILRQHGHIEVREELGRELLDPGACAAFAVADHQLAHIYINDGDVEDEVRRLVEETPGVAEVFRPGRRPDMGLAHPRSGDLVAVAESGAWFTYYYWLDDDRAPDFARTVAIHDKPGYDPVELFLDPDIPFPRLKAAYRVLQKKLGFRYLMDVIPLDPSLVQGSHGRRPNSSRRAPLIISQQEPLIPEQPIEAPDVYQVLQSHLAT